MQRLVSLLELPTTLPTTETLTITDMPEIYLASAFITFLKIAFGIDMKNADSLVQDWAKSVNAKLNERISLHIPFYAFDLDAMKISKFRDYVSQYKKIYAPLYRSDFRDIVGALPPILDVDRVEVLDEEDDSQAAAYQQLSSFEINEMASQEYVMYKKKREESVYHRDTASILLVASRIFLLEESEMMPLVHKMEKKLLEILKS